MILVDTNVLLDIYRADAIWMPWSLKHLQQAQLLLLTKIAGVVVVVHISGKWLLGQILAPPAQVQTLQ